MRWPKRWQNPSAVARLRDTRINCLLIEDDPALRSVIDEAQRNGMRVIHAASEIPGVTVITGEWPGVRMSQSSNRDERSTGPTGLPWIDSNGWKVRLAAALNPQAIIWVDVEPKDPHPGSYSLCFADAAACGGRWIISLDDPLAAGIDGDNKEALETWKDLTRAAEFFATHSYWSSFVDESVVGVVSDFSGDNEFMSNELLNLLTRTTEQYRIIPKNRFSASSLVGLQAVLYADSAAPTPELRKQVLDFVQSGGLLITGPGWGDLPGSPADWDHPRFLCRLLGKGRIAVAKSDDAPDPYLLANDTVVLVSHQFDLLRFWDAGSVNAYLSVAPDRKRAVVQMVFYARELNGKVAMGGPDTATVRVAGRYQTARLLTLDQLDQPMTSGESAAHDVGMVIEKDAVELHLPNLSHYAAVELSV
ncbi:MAG: hypothetical protein WB952_10225 [Terriglobales bacterium]